MKIKRVKVKQAALNSYWYADKIGEEFYVEGLAMTERMIPGWCSYRVIPLGTHENGKPEGHYLDVGDVEVLEEIEGEVIEVTTIMLSVDESHENR